MRLYLKLVALLWLLDNFGLHLYPDQSLFLADNSREGRVLHYDARTGSVRKLVSCGTDECHSIYDVCVTPSGLVYFTDDIQRKVMAYDSEAGNAVDVCGKETECLISVDGCEGSAVFVQPTSHALPAKGTLCVCNVGLSSVKLVSPMSPFVRYMETVNSMIRACAIHHKFPARSQETIKSLKDTVVYLNENKCTGIC